MSPPARMSKAGLPVLAGSRIPRDAGLFVAVAGAYALGYVLAWKWFSAPEQGASFFPPAGVTLATLVLVRRSRWPVVLAAAALTELAFDLGRGFDLDGTLGIVAANVVEPLVGATVLWWLVRNVDLRRKRHLVAFLGSSVAFAPAIGAAIAATTFVAVIGGSGWARFWFEWWAGDGLAVLVVGGAILSLRPLPPPPSRRALEQAVLCGAAVVSTYLVFEHGWFAFVYVPVVALVLLAFRSGVAGVAVTGALASFVAAGVTAEADDFWASLDVTPANRVLYLQLALTVVVAAAMALAAEIAERDRIVARLARAEAERRSAVERAGLLEQVEQSRLQAESLRRSAEQLARSTTVDDVAAVAVAMARAWGAAHSAFFVRDGEGLQLRGMLGPEGPSGPLHGETPLSLETPVTAAVRLRRAVVSDAAALQDRFPTVAAVLETRGWQTYGVFPVEAGGVVTGAVTVAAEPAGWLTPERRELLDPLSAQIGVALGRALLHEETRAARLRERILARLGVTLERRMGFRERADAAARLLVLNGLELVRIHRVGVDGALELAASAGVRRPDAKLRRLDERARVVMAKGETSLLREAPDGAARTGLGAVAPLYARGSLLGTITVRLSHESELAMTVGFAEEIASRVAVSLDNALRYEHERDVSHTLQAGLLGPTPAPVEGVEIASVYRPATEALEVGGDWYDTFRLGETTLGLVVGDVVGHGLDAAVAMGQLRGAVRALAPMGSPSAVLDALDLFVEQVPVAAMATLAYAELDLESGDLVYASAGHPPPLVIGEDGSRLLWDGRSPPLGASFDGLRRSQASDRLRAGETVVLYTDGLVEDRQRGISAGLDALVQVGARAAGEAPSDVVQRVLESVLDAGNPDDDVCLLAVRRTPAAARFVHAFAAAPGELRLMRKALATWLETLDLDPDRRLDVVLAASEAAANAVEHAYGTGVSGTIRVEAWASDHSLHVAVEDAGRWREPTLSSERGRGRAIMESLMCDVSFERGGRGTVVRMRLPLAAPAR